LETYLTEIDTGKIDADYMNSRFDKYLKELNLGNLTEDELQQTLNEVHKSFASLTQEEQKYANIFLHDIQSGSITVDPDKSLRDYITEYMADAKDEMINQIIETFGLDGDLLKKMLASKLTEKTIDEFDNFSQLKSSVDPSKAKVYFEVITGETISRFKVNTRVTQLLKNIILGNEEFKPRVFYSEKLQRAEQALAEVAES
jgi:type I restriction enzyme R subunit